MLYSPLYVILHLHIYDHYFDYPVDLQLAGEQKRCVFIGLFTHHGHLCAYPLLHGHGEKSVLASSILWTLLAIYVAARSINLLFRPGKH